MVTKRTKSFYGHLEKLQCLSEILMPSKGADEDKRVFALCLAEIQSWSLQINEIIKKISTMDSNLTSDDYDTLLGHLVNVKIYLYDELQSWMKDLRKPLQKIIDAVSEKAP